MKAERWKYYKENEPQSPKMPVIASECRHGGWIERERVFSRKKGSSRKRTERGGAPVPRKRGFSY
jgi:hypothetical protein